MDAPSIFAQIFFTPVSHPPLPRPGSIRRSEPDRIADVRVPFSIAPVPPKYTPDWKT